MIGPVEISDVARTLDKDRVRLAAETGVSPHGSGRSPSSHSVPSYGFPRRWRRRWRCSSPTCAAPIHDTGRK
jgi:hypothetical protein